MTQKEQSLIKSRLGITVHIKWKDVEWNEAHLQIISYELETWMNQLLKKLPKRKNDLKVMVIPKEMDFENV